jgi:hypothetical protein
VNRGLKFGRLRHIQDGDIKEDNKNMGIRVCGFICLRARANKKMG